MTTNVPQDVIDDAKAAKAELTYRCAYADMEICPCEAVESDNCHEQIIHSIKFTARTWEKFAQLRDQRAGGEAVYQMKGDSENQWAEITKSAYEELHARKMRFQTRILYTQPQPTLDFSAGMMKAAEICEAKATEFKNSPDKDETNWTYYGELGALSCRDTIRNAIPKESADALKEYVRPLLLKACQLRDKHSAMGYTDAMYQVSDEAIVNSVLEGKS